jgi:hypothetical protein
LVIVWFPFSGGNYINYINLRQELFLESESPRRLSHAKFPFPVPVAPKKSTRTANFSEFTLKFAASQASAAPRRRDFVTYKP